MTLEDINRVQLEIVDTEILDDGMRYQIKLLNGSNYTIKQNIVHFTYPIKLDNGISDNTYKVEATNNKLNIQPGEELLLNVFTPFEGMAEKDILALDQPIVSIVGYLKQVDEESKFSNSRSILLVQQ
ncbi:hypothetical protein JCM9157_5054 [Halalkalibacter akibai JCM 9157]|uniref:Uncharacterized protein n=2 Tax=Halalkalibacter akibai TaxID=1411 RepID=W4R1F3_HALA3|nr:hypothetical protein JCM9157_5054 [Halalkalibacter akibai JCM 9157]